MLAIHFYLCTRNGGMDGIIIFEGEEEELENAGRQQIEQPNAAEHGQENVGAGSGDR